MQCCTAGQNCCDNGCCDDTCCGVGQEGGSFCCTDGLTCQVDTGSPATGIVYKCLPPS
jgi:hypothetical protein